MAKKRVQHEIKIIVILAVLSVIFYGLAFGIKAIQSHQSDETQAYIDKATMLKTFQKIQVENSEEPFVLAKKDGTWYCEADDELAISNLRITMMRTVLKYFAPSRVMTDCASNWADFGLDKPQSIITLTSGDKENTYLVGNYNPVLDQYYMALKGDDIWSRQVWRPLRQTSTQQQVFLPPSHLIPTAVQHIRSRRRTWENMLWISLR